MRKLSKTQHAALGAIAAGRTHEVHLNAQRGLARRGLTETVTTRPAGPLGSGDYGRCETRLTAGGRAALATRGA